MKIDSSNTIAIFVECIFEHASLDRYKSRILLPNPEWLTEQDLQRSMTMIDTIWHMTRHSERLLTPRLPGKKHCYIGFTSLEKTNRVKNYDFFAHMPGKSKTRHTQEIINIWHKNKSLPQIRVQLYGDLSIPQWLKLGKLELYMGFIPEDAYSQLAENFGIHLCTSQMEGFGHYINESRHSAALILTLDAPPMNELIDKDRGLMIPFEKKMAHNQGERFMANEDAIAACIDTALTLSLNQRIELGENSRVRFLEERANFIERINDVL